MNPTSSSSQNNQAAGKDKLNPPPANLPLKQGDASEKIGGEGEAFNIKVPPQGMLGSLKADFNSDSAPRSDKNIKIDLDLNSAPAQNNDYKNTEQYKLSNGEVQGLKPPLVPNNGHKIIFVAIAVMAISALAIGGYYLTQKSGDNVPAVISPTPAIELLIDSKLDSDADNIPDAVEKAIGTNPDKMDTDGDGYNDLAEIKNGYSPLIAGASGKYTPETSQVLKDKIKAADNNFYENNFTVEK